MNVITFVYKSVCGFFNIFIRSFLVDDLLKLKLRRVRATLIINVRKAVIYFKCINFRADKLFRTFAKVYLIKNHFFNRKL